MSTHTHTKSIKNIEHEQSGVNVMYSFIIIFTIGNDRSNRKCKRNSL